jgi:hypothetical protein
MIRIILGVAFKVLETVFKKIAEESQKAETGCEKLKTKCRKKKGRGRLGLCKDFILTLVAQGYSDSAGGTVANANFSKIGSRNFKRLRKGISSFLHRPQQPPRCDKVEKTIHCYCFESLAR